MISVRKLGLQITLMTALVSGFLNLPAAKAVDVDLNTMNLIIDSIVLELVHNPALKDPQDNLPVGVSYKDIEVLGLSVQAISDLETLFTFQVRVPFETVQGVEGDLLCSASYLDSDQVQKVERAVCYSDQLLQPFDDGFEEEDDVILFDEL
jgi:hypothetical protein